MGVDGDLGRKNVRELKKTDPGRFLRLVAGVYNLRVNAGMEPDDAFDQLVSRMVEEGINLPLVVDQYPVTASRVFAKKPDFDDALIRETELRLDRRA